jgi:hypothetical protein
MSIMAPQPLSASEQERKIDRQILAFRQHRPSMMFCNLAEALPDYTWHTLFSALGRLSKQHHVELLAHQWDYEIIFRKGVSREQSVSQPPDLSNQRDHNERTHV